MNIQLSLSDAAARGTQYKKAVLKAAFLSMQDLRAELEKEHVDNEPVNGLSADEWQWVVESEIRIRLLAVQNLGHRS